MRDLCVQAAGGVRWVVGGAKAWLIGISSVGLGGIGFFDIGSKTLTERPIIAAVGRDNDLHIFRPEARILDEKLGQASVKCPLRRRVPPMPGGDVNEDHIVAAVDPEVVGIIDELVPLKLMYELEAVGSRNIVGF